MSYPRSRPKRRFEKPVGWRWGGGLIRWIPFMLISWAGVEIIFHLLAPRMGRWVWIAWMLFIFIWVPFASRLSRRIALWLGGFQQPMAANTARLHFSLVHSCPKCGKQVSKESAICPHCYEDLKTNCRDCGKLIDAGSIFCTECARNRTAQSTR